MHRPMVMVVHAVMMVPRMYLFLIGHRVRLCFHCGAGCRFSLWWHCCVTRRWLHCGLRHTAHGIGHLGIRRGANRANSDCCEDHVFRRHKTLPDPRIIFTSHREAGTRRAITDHAKALILRACRSATSLGLATKARKLPSGRSRNRLC